MLVQLQCALTFEFIESTQQQASSTVHNKRRREGMALTAATPPVMSFSALLVIMLYYRQPLLAVIKSEFGYSANYFLLAGGRHRIQKNPHRKMWEATP